jgi:hypothetical protein
LRQTVGVVAEEVAFDEDSATVTAFSASMPPASNSAAAKRRRSAAS